MVYKKCMTPTEALEKAAALVGGEAELARRLGITKAAVNQWRRAPIRRVIAIEKACDGEVRRHELRPDIYPPEEAAA